MLNRTPTLRSIFLINILAIVPLGYLVRFSPFLPEVIRDLGGNIAYETLLILLVLFVKSSANRSNVAIGVFLVTCALEFLQLNRSPWLQAIRGTTIGRLILGTDFVWSDFIGYAIGCYCGWLWIRLLDRWYRSKIDRRE
jgi:hypothetical protein